MTNLDNPSPTNDARNAVDLGFVRLGGCPLQRPTTRPVLERVLSEMKARIEQAFHARGDRDNDDLDAADNDNRRDAPLDDAEEG